MIVRLKVVILFAVWLFQAPEPNLWLSFGQLAGIIFIAWLVIKRGSKSGDQDVGFWQAQFDEIKKKLDDIKDEIRRGR